MHQQSELFEDSKKMMSWLESNNIRMLPRQLDNDTGTSGQRIYKQDQVKWFDGFYKTKTFGATDTILDAEKDQHLTNVGRACCGGRQVCGNQDYQQRHFFVANKFKDWYCSVNHFFLYVKQVTGEIFVNKDCKMNFDGTVGPIGNLHESEKLLQDLNLHIKNHTVPIIQCQKRNCLCGLCAPKAKSLDTYKSIMEKYQTL